MQHTTEDPSRTGPRLHEDPLVGSEIGSFLVISHLATGGMCELYTAIHTALERHAVLKIPRRDQPYHEIGTAQLISEARILASLHHPNVVEVYDLGWFGTNEPYLALELLEGTALDGVIFENGELPVRASLRIAREVARALWAFHRRDIVCVDVKPENIMLVNGPLVRRNREGEVWVKVIDLGAGVRLGELRVMHSNDNDLQYVGTPAYASPEVALRHPVTPASDVYNLGLMLYEMLSGALPFTARDTQEWLGHHVTTTAPLLSEVTFSVAPGSALERLVNACLSKNPAERPQSMLEVLARLDVAEKQWVEQRTLEDTRVTILPDELLV